jgi:hypothetical protein
MTPSFGMYTDALNLRYFSNCSINSFKASLLSPNRRYILNFLTQLRLLTLFFFLSTILSSAQCLLNTSLNTVQPYFNLSYLTGNLFSLETQCSLAIGNGSQYSPCAVINQFS